MPFLTHAGATLRYDRAGAGPAVLLIHGWLGNRTVWERQVIALRDRFTVITVDLRGHGESSPPRSGYTLGSMAADLEQLVRALGVPRVAIVGWSMGGMIAQELARRLGDRVSALVLVNTTPGGLKDAKSPPAQLKLLEEMRAGVAADFRGFVRAFAPQLFKTGAASPLVPWITGQLQKTPPHVAEACLDWIIDADQRPKLGAIKAPTLVVHSRHDAIFPLAMAEEMAKGIPNAHLVLFEETGHSPGLEEPEQFNELLAEFLANPGKVPSARSAPAAKTAPPAPKPPQPARATKAPSAAPSRTKSATKKRKRR